MPEGLTQREAARILGVSQPYVARLLKEERLRRLDGSKRIDPASVEEVKPTVGSRKADSGSGGRARPAEIAEPDAPEDAPAPAAPEAPSGAPLPTSGWSDLTYAEARRMKEANAAWLKHLEAQEKAGELVERSAVIREWEEIAQHVRERMLGLSVRAATRLGLEPEQKEMLDALVREVLGEFAPDDARH